MNSVFFPHLHFLAIPPCSENGSTSKGLPESS